MKSWIPRVVHIRSLSTSAWATIQLSSNQYFMILSVLDFEQNMVLVACGPYTTSDSITYDPLLDLIAIINRDQPDVCILVGSPPGTTSLGKPPAGKLERRP